jgi:hypothetical protein
VTRTLPGVSFIGGGVLEYLMPSRSNLSTGLYRSLSHTAPEHHERRYFMRDGNHSQSKHFKT